MEYLFYGSALSAVDGRGRVSLPSFVRETVERRSDTRAVIVGPHESDLCLRAYDRNHARTVHADEQRRRLADEASGEDGSAHDRRARLTFGAAEEVAYAGNFKIRLPEMARSRARIEALALFVGAGGSFEIWNPQRALESGDEGLRALAAYRLGQHSQASDH